MRPPSPPCPLCLGEREGDLPDDDLCALCCGTGRDPCPPENEIPEFLWHPLVVIPVEPDTPALTIAPSVPLVSPEAIEAVLSDDWRERVEWLVTLIRAARKAYVEA